MNTRHILRRLRLSDPKADVFLAANVMDAVFTYIALQHETQLTEFNSIIYAIMNMIGTGTTLFLKVVLCVGILWILRKTKKEKLLVPLSLILVVVAMANLMVIRLNGIDVQGNGRTTAVSSLHLHKNVRHHLG
ncbi:DUF5658 family protein [Chloroflexota bacterium]